MENNIQPETPGTAETPPDNQNTNLVNPTNPAPAPITPDTPGQNPTPVISPETPPAGNSTDNSKRTKFLLALIAIIVVGAITYFLSTSVIFKGAFITPGSPEELALKEALDNASKSEKADYETKYIAKHKDETNGIERTLEMTATGQIDLKGDGNGLTHNFTFAGSGSTQAATEGTPDKAGDQEGTPPGEDLGDRTPPADDNETPPPAAPTKAILQFPADNAVVTLPLTLKWQDPENTLDKENKYNWYIKDDLDKKVLEANWSKTENTNANCGLPAAKNSSWMCLATVPEGKLQPGKTYKWAVEAGDGNTPSGYTDEWTFTVTIEDFDHNENYNAPKNLKIGYAINSKELTLKWEKVPYIVNQYILYRKEGTETKTPTAEELNNSNFWTKIETNLDNAKEALYKDTPATGWQKKYSYVVTAKINNDESKPSNIAVSNPDKVGKEVLLEIDSISTKEVKLKWTPKSNTPNTTFHIKRSLGEPKFQDPNIGTTQNNILEYLDTSLPSEKEFYYKIWGIAQYLKNQISNIEKVVIPVAILQAQKTTLSTDEKPKFSWTWQKEFNSEHGDKYFIYRSTNTQINLENEASSTAQFEIKNPDEKTFTDEVLKSVSDGSKFYYALVPKNKNGEPISISNQVMIGFESIASETPTIELTATRIGDKTVNLQWTGGNTNPKAQNYLIYRIPKDEIDLKPEYFYTVTNLNGTHNLNIPINDYGDYTFVIATSNKENIYALLEISNGVTLGMTEPPALTGDKLKVAILGEKPKFTWTENGNPSSDNGKYWLYRQKGKEIKLSADGNDIEGFAAKVGSANPSEKEIIDKSLSILDGSKYYYRLLRTNKNGQSIGVSNEIRVETEKIAEAIALTAKIQKKNKVILQWSGGTVNDTEFYAIYRSTSNKEPTEKDLNSGTEPVQVKMHEDTVPAAGIYHYRIGAVDANGIFEWSNSISIEVPGQFELFAVNNANEKGKEITDLKNNEIKLQWNASNHTMLDKYWIYQSKVKPQIIDSTTFNIDEFISKNPDKIYQFNVDKTQTEYTDKSILSDGSTYYYFIAARAANQFQLEISDIVTVKTVKPQPPPPIELSIGAFYSIKEKMLDPGIKEVKLKFNDSTKDKGPVAKYWIYRSLALPVNTDDDSSGVHKVSIEKKSDFYLYHTDKELTPGSDYYYQAVAKDAGNKILHSSNPVNVITPYVEPVKEIYQSQLTASVNENNQIVLTWNDDPKAEKIQKYLIYRRTEPYQYKTGALEDYGQLIATISTPEKKYTDKEGKNNLYYYTILTKNKFDQIIQISNEISEIASDQALIMVVKKIEENKITLFWNYKTPTDGEKYRYKFYRSKNQNFTPTPETTVKGGGNLLGVIESQSISGNFSDDNKFYNPYSGKEKLENGVVYYYKMEVYKIGESGNLQKLNTSNEISATAMAKSLETEEYETVSQEPGLTLTVKKINYDGITLEWIDTTSVDKKYQYEVYRSEIPNFIPTPNIYLLEGGNKITAKQFYEDTDIKKYNAFQFIKDGYGGAIKLDTTYYFKVGLMNGDKEKTTIFSNEVSAMIKAPQPPILTAEAGAKKGEILLQWTDNDPLLNPGEDDGIFGVYNIYKSTEPFAKDASGKIDLKASQNVTNVNFVPPQNKSFLDKNLEKGKKYYYTVIPSLGKNYFLAISNEASATTQGAPAAFNNNSSFWKPFASLLFADVTAGGTGHSGDNDAAGPIIKDTITGSGTLTYSAPTITAGTPTESTSGLAGTITIKDEYKVFEKAANATTGSIEEVQSGDAVMATLTLTVKDNEITDSTVAFMGQNEKLAFVTEQYVVQTFRNFLKADNFIENHEKEVLKNLKNGIKNNITKSGFIGTNMEILNNGKFKTQTRKMLDANQYLVSYLAGSNTDELNISVDATKKLPTFEGKLAFTEGNEFSYKVYNFLPAGAGAGAGGQQGGQPPTEEKIPFTATATPEGKVTLSWEDPDYIANTTEYQVYRSDSTFEIKKDDDALSTNLSAKELIKIKGKTHQDEVQVLSTVKKYYYAVALLNQAEEKTKKVVKASEVKEVSIGQEQGGCTENCNPGGSGNQQSQTGVGAGGSSGGTGAPIIGGGTALPISTLSVKQPVSLKSIAPSAPTNPYTDVTPETYGYEAIIKLTSQGVVEGYIEKGKKLFKPNKSVIRAEASKLILKSVCIEPGESAKNKKPVYSDVKPAPGIWYFPHTKEAYLRGYFSGYKGKEDSQGRTQFKPENKITRAELTKVLIEVLRRSNFIKVPPIGKTEPWWKPFLKIGQSINLYWQDKAHIPTVTQIITEDEAEEPAHALTRAETAVMIDRTLDLTGRCKTTTKTTANTPKQSEGAGSYQ